MASTSERTFGNRLEIGRKLLDYVKTLSDYAPENPAIQVEPFGQLLADIGKANDAVTKKSALLKDARERRRELYYGDKGLTLLMPMIRDFMGTLPDGKKTSAYTMIQKECRKITGGKIPKKEIPPEKANAAVAKKSISQSEKSYGSLYQAGMNILELIRAIPNYKPANPAMSVAAFEKKLQDIEAANHAVNTYLSESVDAIRRRHELYESDNGLTPLMQTIKEFVRSTYGRNSDEYKYISRIK